MTGTWLADWATNDVVTAAEFRKSLGCIYDSTLGSAAASIDATGLPTTYAHLLVVVQARASDAGTGSAAIGIRFNNDSGANYDWQRVIAQNATASSGNSAAQTLGRIGEMVLAGNTASYATSSLVLIPNYAGTTFYKGALAINGVNDPSNLTSSIVELWHNTWKSTAAINRITISDQAGGNLITGSRMSIYSLGS